MMRRALPTILTLTLLAAGCTLGPEPDQAPVTAADEAPSYVHTDASGDDELPEVSQWWVTLADPVTTELVELALANNTDLRAAAARVLEARAGLAVARGAQLPHVDFNLGAARTKNSFVLPQMGRVGIYSTTYSDQLSVSYQVDLFGRLARTKQAAWAEMLAAEADREALVHTIVGEVVRTRVLIAIIERYLDLAKQTVASWERTMNTVSDRYELGVTTAEDYHLSRQSYASALADVPRRERELAAARHALDVLVGRRAGTGDALPDSIDLLPELEPVPPGLPAELLDRRPDLRAMRMRFSSATARVGVAMANLYPTLNLTGSVGNNSDALSSLISSETLVYSAVAGVLGPLFRGGQLRAEVSAAEARAEAASANYAGAVLRALAEVEDALTAETAIQEQLAARRDQYQSAQIAYDIASQRYNAGTGSLLQLLTADRARDLAETSMILTVNDLWNARIGLFLALGGDWFPEEPSAQTTTG